MPLLPLSVWHAISKEGRVLKRCHPFLESALLYAFSIAPLFSACCELFHLDPFQVACILRRREVASPRYLKAAPSADWITADYHSTHFSDVDLLCRSVNNDEIPCTFPNSPFLKSRRARLQPEQFGLPQFPKRRVPGLRREEIAHLAGIGLAWYTWLEQGRDIQVSDEILSRLADILQLNAQERSHLFVLARGSLPLEDYNDILKLTFR